MRIDVHQHVEEGLALLGGPGRYLGNHRAGADGILVAHEVANHVAVALLAAGNESLHALQLADFAADELEARQHVVDLHPGAQGDVFGQLAGDDGLHHILVARQHAFLLPLAEDVVEEHSHGLVAVEEHPLAVGSLHGHAHAVGVGVGGEHDVGVNLLGQVHGHLHGGLLLGVGTGGGGEVAVGHGLRLHHVHVGEAQLLQHSWNEHNACPVQRRVDDFHVVVAADEVGVEGVLLHAVEVDLVQCLADGFNALLAAGHVDILEVFDFQHLVNHRRVVRGGQLAAVAPICLVAVILLGVVAGGEHHAGVAAVVAHGEAELRRGAHAVEEVDVEAVGGQHMGRDFGKLAAVVAAVVADGGAQLRLAGVAFAHIVGQPLRGHGHGVAVHAVGAHAHDAAQPAGAELQMAVEALVQLRGIVGHRLNGGLGFGVVVAVEPCLYVELCALVDVQCVEVHITVLFLFLFRLQRYEQIPTWPNIISPMSRTAI